MKKHSGALFPAEPCVASGVLRLSGSYIDIYIYSFINVSFAFCLGMLSPGSGEQNLLSAWDELSSRVRVGGMVPFLPAAGVTQMSGIREGQGGQEETGCDL